MSMLQGMTFPGKIIILQNGFSQTIKKVRQVPWKVL